jgi:hypothetical protein
MLGSVLIPLLILTTLGSGVLAPGVAESAAAQSHRAADILNAAAPSPVQYRGKTSQGQPISFQLSSGTVTKLRFSIVIICKSHHRYLVGASRFVPIAIHSGRFGATVRSQNPSASATVSGRRRAGRVTGTLYLRRYALAEHGYCSGTASFSLAR